MTVPVVDVIEAARLLGMTKSGVQKAIARGTIAAVRVAIPTGYKYVITGPEVAHYKRQHRTTRKADR